MYSDGSANRYVFSKNGFEYFPVSPAESSSGIYSGGSYIKKLPELSLFYAVVDNIKMAFETKEDHTDVRQKGSGLIEIWEKESQSKFMIKMGYFVYAETYINTIFVNSIWFNTIK